jgi:hypothetical protein
LWIVIVVPLLAADVVVLAAVDVVGAAVVVVAPAAVSSDRSSGHSSHALHGPTAVPAGPI